MTRLAAVFFALCLTVFALHPPSEAYVLPAPFVIDQMLGNLQLPGQMEIDQRLFVHYLHEDKKQEKNVLPKVEDENEAQNQSQGQTDPAGFDQKVYYSLPGAYRSEIDTAEFQQIFISSGSSSLTVIDGVVLSDNVRWYDCYKDLFVFSSRRPLVNHLKQLGIDMTISSLGRLDKKLVYVCGARYPDQSLPQLWVEKKFFRPVRWIVSPGALPQDPPAREIRYQSWQRTDRTWYPGRIEFLENGRLIRTLVVKDLDVNADIADSLFDISALSDRYKLSEKKPGQEAGTSGEVRRQIEEFNRIYQLPTQ
jgi:hypothetical protein